MALTLTLTLTFTRFGVGAFNSESDPTSVLPAAPTFSESFRTIDCPFSLAAASCRPTWIVKASAVGGFGGGWLEHPRQWLGAQWVSLFLGVLSCRNRQARPEEAQGASWGAVKGVLWPRGRFEHVAAPRRSRSR